VADGHSLLVRRKLRLKPFEKGLKDETMDLKKIVANVKDALTPVVEGLGYELVDVTADKNYGTQNLNVIIYKKGNMGLEDCEKVANAIDPIVDELNPFGEEAFNLNVSSMGLDWKIVTDDDFRRRMGEEIEIMLSAPVDKKKKYVGTLVGYTADAVEISSADKKHQFERKNLAKVVPFVKF